MAEVFGSIGNEPVELNNAATESTLRLLLQSSLAANKQSIDSISKIAKNAGLDPATVAAANNNLNNLANSSKTNTGLFFQIGVAGQILERSFQSLDKSLGPMIAQFTQGTATTSGLFKTLEQLPGVFGAIASVFQKVAAFQENNLEAYRKISSAGATFSGSLTDLRMAALNSYMSLTEFSDLIKSNSQNLVNIGGSVNTGAVAFAKFSNSILKSELGSELMALGYTAQEANQSMLTYLGAAGVSNAKDLQSNRDLREGAKQYLEELDRLAQTTGKSRQEQENTMKKQRLDAEIQTTASRMKDPKERAAFLQNVKFMTDMYGDAGRDMALAQAQGRSVITKEGRLLTAIAPGMTAAYQKMVAAGNQFGIGSKEYIAAQNELSLAAKNGMDRIPTAALGMVKGLDTAKLTVAEQTKQGLDTAEKFAERDEKIEKEKEERKKSEARAAVDAEKAVKEMGQSIMALLLPAIKLITPALNMLLGAVNVVAQALLSIKPVVYGLVAALGAYLALQKIRNITDAANAAKKAGGPGGLRGVFDAVIGKGKGVAPLGTATDPLYVIVLGKGLPGRVGERTRPPPEGRERKVPKFEPRERTRPPTPPVPPTPAPGPTPASTLRAERLATVAEGRAAQAAATTAKIAGAAGAVGALVTAVSAFSEFQDINAKKEKGEITAEEASKEKGGVVGEAVGGLGGAALGAAIGTAILPVIGTAIGGIAGGLLGSYFGKKGGETVMEGPKKPPATPTAVPLAAGGIVTAPTLAVVGEGAAPEAVLPLDKLQSMLTVPTKKEPDTDKSVLSSIVNQLMGISPLTAAVKQLAALKTTNIADYEAQIKSNVSTKKEPDTDKSSQLISLISNQNRSISNQLMGISPLTAEMQKIFALKTTATDTLTVPTKKEPETDKSVLSSIGNKIIMGISPLTAAVKQLSALKTTDIDTNFETKLKSMTEDQRSKTLEGLTSTTSMMGKEAEQMFKRSILTDKAFNIARAEKTNMPVGITGQESSGFLSRISDIISKISPVQPKEKSENTDRESDKSSGLINDLTFNKSPKTLETANDQLIALNKVSAEMLRYLKEMSDYSRRNVDATRSLNRDFFKA